MKRWLLCVVLTDCSTKLCEIEAADSFAVCNDAERDDDDDDDEEEDRRGSMRLFMKRLRYSTLRSLMRAESALSHSSEGMSKSLGEKPSIWGSKLS
jgi:hypothetical protein